ncbi:MAG: succinate dehydrogenase, cytochrome b556 subunit [Alphaproteobacteria bacterium]
MSTKTSERPLSPHIMIYRLMPTMIVSMSNRLSGMALYIGTLVLAWWLVAAAAGPEAYATFQWYIGSIVGRLVLFGFTWALINHMFGGFRHLTWDTGRGFELPTLEIMAWVSFVGALSVTIVLWIIGYGVK